MAMHRSPAGAFEATAKVARALAGDPHRSHSYGGIARLVARLRKDEGGQALTELALVLPFLLVLLLASKTRRVVYRDSRIVVISQRSPRPSES